MSYALLVVLVFMGGTTTGCRAFQVPYSFHVRPYAALRCESEEHLPGSDVLDTHDLLEGIGEMEDDAMPAEMRARILEEGGANEWDMKLEMTGFTPLTNSGFALAAANLTLNTVQCTGWAADLVHGQWSLFERGGGRPKTGTTAGFQGCILPGPLVPQDLRSQREGIRA